MHAITGLKSIVELTVCLQAVGLRQGKNTGRTIFAGA